jgi:predicted nucleic acid-binding protein
VSSNKTVYWDTCLFFALIKDEKRSDPTEMAGLYNSAAEIDRGEVNMITGAVTLTELSDLSAEARIKLDRLLERSNVDVISLSPYMGMRAGQLRDYYNKQPGPNLCRDDAYHLATAVVANVHAFYTFDERDKKGCRGLIGLDGNVAGFPLRIMKPTSIQGQGSLGM